MLITFSYKQFHVNKVLLLPWKRIQILELNQSWNFSQLTSFLNVFPWKKRSVGRDSNGSGGLSSMKELTTCTYGATTSLPKFDMVFGYRPKSTTIWIEAFTWFRRNLKALGCVIGMTWSLPLDLCQYLDSLKNFMRSIWGNISQMIKAYQLSEAQFTWSKSHNKENFI